MCSYTALSISSHPLQTFWRDELILAKRKEVYDEAKKKSPMRCASGKIRNWEPIQEVAPNPSKRKEEASLGERKSVR